MRALAWRRSTNRLIDCVFVFEMIVRNNGLIDLMMMMMLDFM